MAKSVVPVAEHPHFHGALDLPPRALSEFAVQRLEHRRAILHDERQLEDAQLRGRLREAHRGHVAERELAALGHRNEVARFAPDLEDAPDQLEGDPVAQPLLEELAEAARRPVVDGGGLLVAPELETDRRGQAGISRWTNSTILSRASSECGCVGDSVMNAWLMPSKRCSSTRPPALR